MAKHEMEEKEEVINELEQLWGPRCIEASIPLLQRPCLGSDYSRSSRSKSARYKWNPQKWPLPVLNAIVVIAKLTTDKTWVRNAVEIVVRYRTNYTKDYTPHVIVADCEVIEIMLVKKCSLIRAFTTRQKNSLIDHKKQDESNEETKHAFDVSQEFDDESDFEPENKEAGSDASEKAGHSSGPNAKQRGLSAASGEAQSKGKHTQTPASEISWLDSRGGKQKKRKHSAIEGELSEANSFSTERDDLARDTTSRHNHTGYDICSSSPSLPWPSPPPRCSTTKLGKRKPSRYGMFPPPRPPRATTPPAQNTSEPQRRKDENHSNVNHDSRNRTKPTPDHRKDDTNTRFDYNNNENNDEDETDDDDDDDDVENILKAKLAAAEAELNLARLRVAAAESAAARKAKKARTSVSSRRNSTSSS